jgi:hypothetical protein
LPDGVDMLCLSNNDGKKDSPLTRNLKIFYRQKCRAT